MSQLAKLDDRRVLAVTGADRVPFLNGLVSNDVSLAGPGRAVWSALLTPQGRYLADFFIFAEPDRLLLDCAVSQSDLVRQRLLRYRLRADVAVEPTPLHVYAAWGGMPHPTAAIAAADPRLDEAGWRLLSEAPLQTNAGPEDWDLHRLRLGLPDGPRDLEPEKTILLEAGFDELGGISWTKGCYMGQELTARTRYRGLVRRRLLPVHGQQTPPHGARITSDGREVGEMRSSRGAFGLAVLRLEAVGQRLECNGLPLTVALPGWIRLPEPA
jgi:folate-binding protein YgfZ